MPRSVPNRATVAPASDDGGTSPEGALGRVMVVGRALGVGPAPVAAEAAVPEALAAPIRSALGEVAAATSSVTEALRAARGGDVDAVLVVCAGVDRFADEWAGPRLLSRLRRRTQATVIAAVPAGDLDGAHHAAHAGAHLLTTWPRAADDRPIEPAAAFLASLDAEADQAAFVEWFSHRFGLRWRPWMAEAAAAVAATADRDRQAEWCHAWWETPAKRTAQRRLRELRSALSGEVRDEGVLERRVAIEVLRALGRSQRIPAAPPVSRSLRHAAHAVRADPSLVEGLVDEPELALLLGVEGVMKHLAARSEAGPGRPPSGAWLAARHQAVGKLAACQARHAKGDKRTTRDDLMVLVDDLVLLVHDALDDAARVLD